MKKVVFFLKLSVYVSVIACFIWFDAMTQYSATYNAALIDKWNRLKSIKEPKIILVGDSNVALNFDSKKIQEAFNMPVVNFGLSRVLGETFYTDMVKPHINEGDIVVISPVVYSYTNTEMPDYTAVWTAIGNNIGIWQGISSENYTKIILAYPTFLRKAISRGYKNKKNAFVLWINNKDNPPEVYSRATFNEYGDNAYPRPNCIITEENYQAFLLLKNLSEVMHWFAMPSLSSEFPFFASMNLSEVMRVYWNQYNEYILSKNARLFISGPPILDETLPNDWDSDALQKQLKDELNFPMISRLHNYIYPLEYFYDSGGHLNDVGKAIHTKQFILDLSAALSASTLSDY